MEMFDTDTIDSFVFKSNRHQRFENGIPVRNMQKCTRTITVEKNTEGCDGYLLDPGVGYIVKIYNNDNDTITLTDKPMKVVRKTINEVELRGFPVVAILPLTCGFQEVDHSDYGFVVYYEKGKVVKCVLHRYDRDLKIEYFDSQISTPNTYAKSSTEKNNLFCKSELEQYIATLSKMGYLFQKTTLLEDGRNEKMKSYMFSYAGILGYYYENEYQYGNMEKLVDQDIAVRYTLVSNSMRDVTHKRNVVAALAENWSDVLQVIFDLQLNPNEEGERFFSIRSEIQAVTAAFEKLSGSKCREPKDPRNVRPRNVTYNPYNITEDFVKSQGHVIPDITNVFARELIPQLLENSYSSKAPKDIVADYALSMIKSYYDNAGFVPMLIVDQITGQINRVAEMVQNVSYTPYTSLKEYVLSKIYK